MHCVQYVAVCLMYGALKAQVANFCPSFYVGLLLLFFTFDLVCCIGGNISLEPACGKDGLLCTWVAFGSISFVNM